VPDQTIRTALKFMGRSADERVPGSTARDICESEHIKAMLSGSIATLGSQYVVVFDATNCATGDSLAREQVTAATKEAVLPAVGKAVSSLRGKLGESLASIQKFDTPVTDATTSSLEALRAYAAADAMRNGGGEAESIPLFQHAVELDPNFALAYARLAAIYNNIGEEDRGVKFARKAFDLQERVSERERFYITDHFYTANGDIEKDKETLDLAIKTYPNDSNPYANLALIYSLFYGEYEKAIPLANEFSRLEPNAPLWLRARGWTVHGAEPCGGIALHSATGSRCQGGQPLHPRIALPAGFLEWRRRWDATTSDSVGGEAQRILAGHLDGRCCRCTRANAEG